MQFPSNWLASFQLFGCTLMASTWLLYTFYRTLQGKGGVLLRPTQARALSNRVYARLAVMPAYSILGMLTCVISASEWGKQYQRHVSLVVVALMLATHVAVILAYERTLTHYKEEQAKHGISDDPEPESGDMGSSDSESVEEEEEAERGAEPVGHFVLMDDAGAGHKH